MFFRYLKAAFWAAPEVAGIGRLPANVIALAGFAILGFGHPGFWLLGLALEASYLYALASNPRFCKYVDALRIGHDRSAAESQRLALVNKLTTEARGRLALLEDKCAKVSQLEHDAQMEDFIIEGNREAMRKLAWLYLKVLLAQQNLRTVEKTRSEDEIRRQVTALQGEVVSGRLSPSLKESKEATLQLLGERLANSERNRQALAETESDLARIEALVDLAMDKAGMRGSGESISTNIELVSQLLDDSIYGESGHSIAVLDKTFGRESI